MPDKKKNKLHLIWDIGAIIAVFSAVIGITYYCARENARLDYLTEQVKDIKENQAQYNEQYNRKLDKIYDILRGK